MNKVILTGDRPTGKLHLGHYVGSLQERLNLQNNGDYDDMYIMIADTQALTDNYGNPQKVRDNIVELMLDYLSIGLDPNKITFFVQSTVRALPELTMFYQNLVTLPRLLRNPTIKNEIQLRGFNKDNVGIPVGFANYPISQAADITAFKANIIPVGDDQLPMIEQTNEIVKAFNSTYGNVLVNAQAKLPENKVCLRLPGIDGKEKMSKSLGNAIFLSDSEAELKKKINMMYTDPMHINITDPGHIEGNIVFTYLDAFASPLDFPKYLPEYQSLVALKEHYQKGGVGDSLIKKFLFNIINEKLIPIRKKRQELSQDIPAILDILIKGNAKANKMADQTLKEVKKAMNIDYFDDPKYLKEQIALYKMD